MRREIFRAPRDIALAVLNAAPFVHVASTTPDGAPILRTVHGVVVDGALCFHGAPAGEKLLTVGRTCVIQAQEVIAEVPSFFTDAEKACPATTYYRSAQVHGLVERVDDDAIKARVLQALMERFQAEGGHVPIDVHHPRYEELYARAVRGILVLRVSLAELDGKAKLGQNRTPTERRRVLELLWQRGRIGDPRAIDLVRSANDSAGSDSAGSDSAGSDSAGSDSAGSEVPAFLAAPKGVTLRCALGRPEAAAVAALLQGTYWNTGMDATQLASAHLGSSAWVGAIDAQGTLVASARALADGSKLASIHDVIVDDAWRGRGVGRAIVRLLLDHPRVRGCTRVRLATRDAAALYARFGFTVCGPSPYTEMILHRTALA